MVDTLGGAGLTATGFGFTKDCAGGGSFLAGCTATGANLGEHAAKTSATTANKHHLFPLNGSRRFRTDIIYYPVNPFYIVNNLVRDFGQQIIWQMTPVGRHA